jgi:hypothetical protein
LTTPKPKALELHPKVAAVGIGSYLAVTVVWAIKHWIDIPPDVAVAISGAIVTVCGWLAPQAT